jgi:HAMP domain-containing protein
MSTKKRLRGTGFKHTLPAVLPFSAVWVAVVVLTAPAITIGMMAGGLVAPEMYSEVWFFLATRVPVLALAAIGLAIFATSRAAGPLVALRTAFEDVKGGDLSRRIRFRRSDRHFREVERAFNEMMEALDGRVEPEESPEVEGSEPGSAS